jgi:hypothetical protein
MPLSISDSYYWFLTSENIVSGFGLYGREGFYYSPPFGYMIGLSTTIGSFIFGIPMFASHIDSLYMLQTFYPFHPIVTTAAYNITLTIPLIIGDILISYLVYWFVKERTGDAKKALTAFMLCFLCPLLIFGSSIHGMMDVYSALLAFAALIFISKERYFLAGTAWSAAVFTKVFPGLLLPIFMAFIIRRHKGDIKAIATRIGQAAAGGIFSFLIIYYPVLMDGTFIQSWSFLTSRVSGAGSAVSEGGFSLDQTGFLVGIIAQVAALIFAIYLAYRYTKREEDRGRRFFQYALLSVAAAFLWVPMPQYLILLIPFVVFHAVLYDGRYITSWILISAGAVLFIAMVEGPLAMLQSLATSTDLMNADSLISYLTHYISSHRIGMYSLVQVIPSVIGAALQFTGVALLFLFWHKKFGRDVYET